MIYDDAMDQILKLKLEQYGSNFFIFYLLLYFNLLSLYDIPTYFSS